MEEEGVLGDFTSVFVAKKKNQTRVAEKSNHGSNVSSSICLIPSSLRKTCIYKENVCRNLLVMDS